MIIRFLFHHSKYSPHYSTFFLSTFPSPLFIHCGSWCVRFTETHFLTPTTVPVTSHGKHVFLAPKIAQTIDLVGLIRTAVLIIQLIYKMYREWKKNTRPTWYDHNLNSSSNCNQMLLWEPNVLPRNYTTYPNVLTEMHPARALHRQYWVRLVTNGIFNSENPPFTDTMSQWICSIGAGGADKLIQFATDGNSSQDTRCEVILPIP